jgi:TM2 domain-containing membrane protein YozV
MRIGGRSVATDTLPWVYEPGWGARLCCSECLRIRRGSKGERTRWPPGEGPFARHTSRSRSFFYLALLFHDLGLPRRPPARMFASVGCAYALWAFLGFFGAHVSCYGHPASASVPRVLRLPPCAHRASRPVPLQRFYVGRPMSGLVWLFTGGLFGVGWAIDFFLIPQFVEEVREGEEPRSCRRGGDATTVHRSHVALPLPGFVPVSAAQ